MDKITDLSKTIIALATTPGTGSISIIRISGPQSIQITNGVFKGKNLTSVQPNTIHYGKIVKGGKIFDQVLVSVFHAPRSYSGEDYIEISCHANPYIVSDIMDILIEAGAHSARPGEFTLRAFLNGKIDLSQAEAVAGIIKAKSRVGLTNALEQLKGSLTGRILSLKDELIEIIGLMEMDLDFSEEDLKVAPSKELSERLGRIMLEFRQLAASFNYAKLLEGGIHLTIIGEPNVGKSTLLNQLLGEERAITSEIPGTTRDTIHENVVIHDVLFRLVDTAGLRTTHDELEREGIKRARSQVSLSDLVLLVVDTSKELSDTSWNLVAESVDWIMADIILVANKTDLGKSAQTLERLSSLKKPLVEISAKNAKGIKDLEKSIIDQISEDFEQHLDDLIITSKRQKEVLEKTAGFLETAILNLKNNLGYEFTSIDLRQAINILGEISGETVTDDILNKIFSNFCIGK